MKKPFFGGIVLTFAIAMQGYGAETGNAQLGRRLVREDIPPLGKVVRVDIGERMMVQNDYEVETLSAGTRIKPGDSSTDVAVLYDAPSPKAKPILELRRGTPVKIIIGVGNWVKISDSTGRLAWVEKNAIADTLTEVITSRAGNIQRVIEYTGRSDNRLMVSYKEYNVTKDGVFIRPAFTQDFMFDLSQGPEIGLKGARIRIIEASNIGIAFEVLKHFER